MRDRYNLVFEQPEGKEPLFSVRFPVVLDREGQAPEDIFCISKVDSVLPPIL